MVHPGMSDGFAALISPLRRLGSNGRARTLASDHSKPKMPTRGRHFRFGPPGEIRTPDTQVRSLVLYPAELRAERLSLSTGREVYHGFSVVALAYSTILSGRLAAASRGSFNWGLSMNTDRAFVSATLMADENRSTIETRLSTLLEHSLTPMEPGQAKTYMEHTAVRMAEEAGAGVTMFQMVEIKNANSAYLIRVAVLTNGSAIGLDLMDLENGQYFIPETCPVIPLEVPTIN